MYADFSEVVLHNFSKTYLMEKVFKISLGINNRYKSRLIAFFKHCSSVHPSSEQSISLSSPSLLEDQLYELKRIEKRWSQILFL